MSLVGTEILGIPESLQGRKSEDLIEFFKFTFPAQQSRVRPLPDVWMGCIDLARDLESGFPEKFGQPKTGVDFY